MSDTSIGNVLLVRVKADHIHFNTQGGLDSAVLSFQEIMWSLRDAKTHGVYNEDGFVVMAGSSARPILLESAGASLHAQHEELIDSGAIVADGSSMHFQRDTVFPSPSTATSVVCGGKANG